MFDISQLEQYRENSCLAVKDCHMELPTSLWETLSAFANTYGGVILLGVLEQKDKSLQPVGLSNPEGRVQEFWNHIHNPNKVSVNVLSERDVTIENLDGKSVVAIHVPRAIRNDRPVYINGNPITGTYRRNGEGDYRCTKSEVNSMLRDAADNTQDRKVLDYMNMDVFDFDTIRSYRNRMNSCRPGHVWGQLDNEDFLYRLGAIGRTEEGTKHPTAAGLLMFGKEYEIVREYPDYFLDYQEQFDDSTRWTNRFVSTSGEWSGNLFDFYFRVYRQLMLRIPTPFRIQNGIRIDNTPVHDMFREVLANCLVNADYYGTRGVVVINRPNQITFANPGAFRIPLDVAKIGGVSDPRNSELLKMFTLLDVGERAGTGIPNLYYVCNTMHWLAPTLEEEANPSRTILTVFVDESFIGGNNISADKTADKKGKKALSADKTADKKGEKAISADKTADKKGKKAVSADKTADKTDYQKRILAYLSKHESAKVSDLASKLSLSERRTREYLSQLITQGQVIAVGSRKFRTYQLANPRC